MNRLQLKQLDLQQHDSVLEVGFGGGGLLAMILASTSGEVHGVDISRPMVQRASRRFRRHGRLHLHRASAEALPLPDAAVDKACSVNNIYFWGDPAAAMAEFARVIRTGGRPAICFDQADDVRTWQGPGYGLRPIGGAEGQRL